MKKQLIAYCWANGLIEFGSKVPDGAIEIARGDTDTVRQSIIATARHGKRVLTSAVEEVQLLVSGIPEAESPQAAGDALIAYLLWLKQRECKGFEVAITTTLEGPLNPFYSGEHCGDMYYSTSADDRIRAAKTFNSGQCRIALMLPDLQKTVRTAVERRRRQLETVS
jgi:hypothetical protein